MKKRKENRMNTKRLLCIALCLVLCLSLGTAAFASSGEASGSMGSGEMAGYDNRPVFASSVYEMESAGAVTASYAVHGYYSSTTPTDEDAFELLPFAPGTAVTAWTDAGAGTPAAVTPAFDGQTLTLTFDKAPEGEFFCYVLFDDGETEFSAVPVYVVSFASVEQYLDGSVDYRGYELRYDPDSYTPGAVYYEQGIADAIVGGAIDLFGAEDFADEIAEAAQTTGYAYEDLYAAVDWYLNNGCTTGGDTWTEFVTDRYVNVNPTDGYETNHAGDGYLRVEACYYLFRYYWMNNTTYEVTAGDSVTGIFADNMNKLYPDFNDFFWGHYYCTWFQALNPALRSGFLFKYDSLVDPDGTNTDQRGMYKYRAELGHEGQLPYGIDQTVNWGDFLNMVYNAITGGQSALNEAGEAACAALSAAGGSSRAANAQAVLDYFGFELDLAAKMEETVSKWDAVMFFHCLKGTSDAAKEIPDDNTEDLYYYNTTKWGELAKDTYLDTDTYYERKGITEYTAETNHYGLTSMAAVTISDADTVDEAVWAGCDFFYAGDWVIVLDDTAILDEVKTETGRDEGVIYYQAGYSAEEYGGEKTYIDLAFAYELNADGSLHIDGVEGFDAFASGTSWNTADVGSFYCSGLWVRDGAQVELHNVSILAQASATGDDIRDDSHRFFGGGDGLQVTDKDTRVTVTNDNGQIFLIGTGGTSAGPVYAGAGSATVVSESTLFNQSGHPFSIFYNGVLVHDRNTIMNSGRIFNSDASSGTIIFNDTVTLENSGGSVMDETCTAFFTNSFTNKLSGWEVNGNAQAIFTNSTVESGGAFTYSNKTSMTTDVGEVVIVNSSFLAPSNTFATATRGGRGYLHVIDSLVNWGGSADTVLFSVAGPNTWTGSELYVDVDNSDFPTEFAVKVAGDCINSVRGWNDDVLTYDSVSTLFLDMDEAVKVSMDCSSTVTCSFSMVGVTDVFQCTGNVVFVEDGSYTYTGLDADGALYNEQLVSALTDNGDGTADVTYTLADGSTMTYTALPYTAPAEAAPAETASDDPPPIPDGLQPGEEPPGGFGGI